MGGGIIMGISDERFDPSEHDIEFKPKSQDWSNLSVDEMILVARAVVNAKDQLEGGGNE